MMRVSRESPILLVEARPRRWLLSLTLALLWMIIGAVGGWFAHIHSIKPPEFDPDKYLATGQPIKGMFDDLPDFPARVEVQPPAVAGGYEYGMQYDGPKGTKWTYVGGNSNARAAWRVVNHKGEFVMPRPTSGNDAESLYNSPAWRDVLGMTWSYSGKLDAVGDPLVTVPFSVKN